MVLQRAHVAAPERSRPGILKSPCGRGGFLPAAHFPGLAAPSVLWSLLMTIRRRARRRSRVSSLRTASLIALLLVTVGLAGSLAAQGQTAVRVQVRGDHLVDA